MIPLADEDGFYYIRGKKYYLIYQMLEKSTYTSSSSVTLKSLMPIAVKRHVIEIEDMDGHLYNVPYYTVFVFRKEIVVLLFYLSNGFDFTMDYLNVSDVIKFLEEMPKERDPDKLYFGLSSKCFMEVDKDLFNEHQYIQSIVGAFKEITTSRVSMTQLRDTANWIKKIANPANYDKGYSILKYVGRLLDLTTQKVLILPDYYNQDIYGILKWINAKFSSFKTLLIAGNSLELKLPSCNNV